MVSSTEQSAAIAVERHNQTAVVWLDRPERQNCFIRAMIDELHDQFARLDADESVRAIVVTGRGKVFSAGADMEPDRNIFDTSQQPQSASELPRRIRPWDLATPIIAALNGNAVGIGLTLPLQWDIRIAAREGKYSFVFPRRGLVPEQNSVWLLPRLVGFSTALELLLTGRTFDGSEAARIGLAHQTVPAAEVLDTALAVADQIAATTSPAAVAATKRLCYQQLAASDRDRAFEDEWAVFRWFGRQPDVVEGMKAFFEKRNPEWPMTKSSGAVLLDGDDERAQAP